jgi:hypothetical protein
MLQRKNFVFKALSSFDKFQKIFAKKFLLYSFIRKQFFDSSFDKSIIKEIIIFMKSIRTIGSEEAFFNTEAFNSLPCNFFIKLLNIICILQEIQA